MIGSKILTRAVIPVRGRYVQCLKHNNSKSVLTRNFARMDRDRERYSRRGRRSLVPKDKPVREDPRFDGNNGKSGLIFKLIGATGVASMATLYMYYVMNVGARPLEDRVDDYSGEIDNNYNNNSGVDPWSSNPNATHGEVDGKSGSVYGSTSENDNLDGGNFGHFQDDDPWQKKNSPSSKSNNNSKWT
eukprot:g6150.t1